jgi:hypothetical protein
MYELVGNLSLEAQSTEKAKNNNEFVGDESKEFSHNLLLILKPFLESRSREFVEFKKI